jgi:hypothetical protein
MTGTRMTYRQVMKPAFPAEVCTRPACWRFAAVKTTRPARAAQAALRATLRGSAPGWGRPLRAVRRLDNASRGSSDSVPSANRAALKAKGPITAMPLRWATKEMPQMKAVASSSPSVLIMPSRPLLSARGITACRSASGR